MPQSIARSCSSSSKSIWLSSTPVAKISARASQCRLSRLVRRYPPLACDTSIISVSMICAPNFCACRVTLMGYRALTRAQPCWPSAHNCNVNLFHFVIHSPGAVINAPNLIMFRIKFRTVSRGERNIVGAVVFANPCALNHADFRI